MKISMLAKIAPFSEMVFAVCTIDRLEKRDRSAPSEYHHRIFKCRSLIFQFDSVIASPDYRNDQRIFIIYKENDPVEERLWTFIDKSNMKLMYTGPVDASMYETCFKYTLIAKLAPLWNHVDVNLLVNGRDFLTWKNSEAIKFNIHAYESAVSIEIERTKIRLSPLDVEDLYISFDVLERFRQSSNGVMTENSILRNLWVTILPSCKRGQIINIYKQIPETSLFRNYKDLRRHWKNIYGYRLPEDNSNIIYYDIHFPPLGPELYTYPSICVQSSVPIIIDLPKERIEKIGSRFLDDVNKTVSRWFDGSIRFNYVNNEMMIIESPSLFNPIPPELLRKDNWNNSPEVVSGEIIEMQTTQHISLCTPTQKSVAEKIIPVFSPIKRNAVVDNNDKRNYHNKIAKVSPSFVPIRQNSTLKHDDTPRVPNDTMKNRTINNNVLCSLENTPDRSIENGDLSKNPKITSSERETNEIYKKSSTTPNSQPKKTSTTKKSQKICDKVDIFTLAKSPGALDKLTVSVLYNWLRSQGAQVTTKHKKSQLLEKVHEVLNSKVEPVN